MIQPLALCFASDGSFDVVKCEVTDASLLLFAAKGSIESCHHKRQFSDLPQAGRFGFLTEPDPTRKPL